MITSLSFAEIIATVECPWRECRAPIGMDCGTLDNVPHKSRFKAAKKELEDQGSDVCESCEKPIILGKTIRTDDGYPLHKACAEALFGAEYRGYLKRIK